MSWYVPWQHRSYPGTPLYTQVSTWDDSVRTGVVPSTTLQMFAGRPRDSDRQNIVQVDKSNFLGLRSRQARGSVRKRCPCAHFF